MIQYETALKADGFLVTVRGATQEMARAKDQFADHPWLPATAPKIMTS